MRSLALILAAFASSGCLLDLDKLQWDAGAEADGAGFDAGRDGGAPGGDAGQCATPANFCEIGNFCGAILYAPGCPPIECSCGGAAWCATESQQCFLPLSFEAVAVVNGKVLVAGSVETPVGLTLGYVFSADLGSTDWQLVRTTSGAIHALGAGGEDFVAAGEVPTTGDPGSYLSGLPEVPTPEAAGALYALFVDPTQVIVGSATGAFRYDLGVAAWQAIVPGPQVLAVAAAPGAVWLAGWEVHHYTSGSAIPLAIRDLAGDPIVGSRSWRAIAPSPAPGEAYLAGSFAGNEAFARCRAACSAPCVPGCDLDPAFASAPAMGELRALSVDANATPPAMVVAGERVYRYDASATPAWTEKGFAPGTLWRAIAETPDNRLILVGEGPEGPKVLITSKDLESHTDLCSGSF